MDGPVFLAEHDYRELATFLEEQLPHCQTSEEGDELRRRLACLYAGPLKEPLRAAGYVDELLGGIEALVTKEPGDDELRQRYIGRARSVGAQARAADTLGRALKKVKAADVRERVGFDIGSLHLQEKELKQARSAFLEVVLVGAGGPSALASARFLLDPEVNSGDPQVIATALETIAKSEANPQIRHEAAERLLLMHESKPLKESRLLVVFQALLDSPRADEALAWLCSHYERKGDQSALADVYRRKALSATDPALARLLAVRSIELSPAAEDGDRIGQWLWFLEAFGPDAQVHAKLIPFLEQAQRWEDLCRVLEADVELATPEQRAPRMARVGQIRLVILADTEAALSAFRRCLSLDPWNELARTTVEGLMAAGDSRLAAADVLEPVYRVAKFHEGELRVLETRAELLAEPAGRLAALAAAVDVARGKLTDPRRAMQLCERALREAFAFASEAVLDWVVRLERVAAVARQPEAQAALLLGLLRDGPLNSPERLALAVSAIDALIAAGAPDRALALCERGMAGDPSSSELLRRIDALRQGTESPQDRVARYESALRSTSDSARRHSLMHTIAAMRRDTLSDPEGAIAIWRSIAEEDPDDFAAQHQLTLVEAQLLARQGTSDRALELCRELAERPYLTPAILQGIAQLAGAHDDPILYGRSLKLLASCDDANVKRAALERYAEFLFSTMDDGAAAVECWKAAAQMAGEEPPEQDRARRLYERVLEVQPEDIEAAAQLIELYAQLRDWAHIPRALRALIRGDDLGRCVLLLLRLETSAVSVGAFDEFLSLTNELGARLAAASADGRADDRAAQSHALGKARARVLASEPARRGEASEAYRALVEAFESEEDVRDYASHIDSIANIDARHENRRWLYGWRAAHSARPAEVLLEWAKAEEAHGDLDVAVDVYRQLADVSGDRKLALKALVRLKLQAGDFTGIEQVAEELDGHSAVELFDSLLAITAADGAFAGAGGSVSEVETARNGWLQRIVELSPADPATALSSVLRGAIERPDSEWLWDSAEGLARDLGSIQEVSRAYHDLLVGGAAEPALAEMIGRRLIALEEECALDAPRLIKALDRVLELVPAARWALDRIKLALGALGQYGELFNLFDRAIDAAADAKERAELLHEAACAARDLAGEPQRAIAYFESLRALRPDDASVEGALERLYEKLGRTVELIELLCRRLERASGFQRRDLYRRVASLWLEVGDVERAGAVVEEMLLGDTGVVDVIDVLERIVQQPVPAPQGGATGGALPATVQDRAIERLRSHYESVGRLRDVLRMAERSRTLSGSADKLARCVRDLVNLHIRSAAAEGIERVFEQVSPRIEAYLTGDPRIAKVARKALLIQAIRALKADPTPGARADAEDGAWAATQSLLSLSMDTGDVASALRLLNRCSQLPLGRGRQRELLGTAAFVCSDVGQELRAIDIFARLFHEDAGDTVASRSLERFSKLLEAAGRHADLARVWEGQAGAHAKNGKGAEERASWQRAAELWEREGSAEPAIEAHRRAAALGGEASFEALARIHAGRREWTEAARALEWLVAHAPAGARAKRALRLSDAYVQLGERARAAACLEDALRLAAGQGAADGIEDVEPIRGRLIEQYRTDQEWRPLARLLSADAERVTDTARKLASLREAAELHRHRLDEPGEAAVLLEKALALDPHDAALRGLLVEVLERLEQWDRTVDILRAQVDFYGEARSKDRAVTHHRLARALVRANLPTDALRELGVASEMNPTHRGILYDLARAALELEQLELAEKSYRALLLAVHRSTEDSASSPSRADIFVDLSEIALRRGDIARASDWVDSAFDEAVERGEDPQRLERGLRARGRNDLLARALERRVQRGTTLTDRAVALGELAQLWGEPMGRPSDLGARIREDAERIARDLGREEVTDASAWIALSCAYAAFGGEGQLSSLLTSAIPKVHAGAERSRLRVILARTLLEQRERVDAAVNELSKALAEEPTGREAVELMSEVLEREGRFDALVTVLEKRLHVLSSGEDSQQVVDATWRYGQALELSGRRNDAVVAYESLLDLRPADSRLARDLANRLEDLGSDRLADGLEQWMALDTDAAAEISKKLAALRQSRGDTAGVIRALEQGFSAQPKDAELRDRLVKGYEERAEWEGVARVLARAVEALPGERPLLIRLVDARQRAGMDQEALRELDVAVAARADDAELLLVRAKVRERLSDWEGALTDLERASVLNAAHITALVELFGKMGGSLDAAAVGAHTIRLVDALLRVNRPKQARRELDRLLARNPNHREGLARLASVAAMEGNWKSAAESNRKLLALIEDSSSPEELARVAVATADACQRAGVLEEAREALARALAAVERSPELLPDLEQLCQAMKDWRRLASVLMARAESEPSEDAKADLLLRAGRLLLDEASEPASALPVLDQFRSAKPESVDGRLLWARAQVALGNVQEALKLLYDTIERSPDKRSPGIAIIYLEIGKAHLAVDELPEALFALESGFSVDWRTGDIAMQLGLVALDLGEDKTAERAFSAVTTLPSRKGLAAARADAAAKATAYYHLATAAVRKGDLAKARRLAGKALGGEPHNIAAARALIESLDSSPASVGAVAK
jgi:tetratricopeptide (TPR) repeat protein